MDIYDFEENEKVKFYTGYHQQPSNLRFFSSFLVILYAPEKKLRKSKILTDFLLNFDQPIKSTN